MKALILSFFAVILGYSLIFDEKKFRVCRQTGQYADFRFRYDI